MSIDKNNKELYDKILDATKENKDIDFAEIHSGYGYCSISHSYGGSFAEGTYSVDTTAGTIFFETTGGYSFTPAPFLSSRVLSAGGGYRNIEYYIPAGTVLDYETLGTSPVSTCWTGTATASPDCVQSGLTVCLIDVNEKATPSISTYVICTDLSAGVVAEVCQIDDDTLTPAFKTTDYTITGPNASRLSPSAFTISGNACQTITMNSQDLVSPSNFVLSYDHLGVTYNIPFTIFVAGYESPVLDTTNPPRPYYIPSGLETGNVIIFDRVFATTDSALGNFSSDPNDHCNSCSAASLVLSDAHPVGSMGAVDSVGSAVNSVDYVGLSLRNYNNTQPSAAGSITGNYQIFLSMDFTVSSSSCCGYAWDEYYRPIYGVGSPLESYKTGIGPDLPFSGGVGNVEGSFFVDFGPHFIAVSKPMVTGYSSVYTSGVSLDNPFIYTYGQTGLFELIHPTYTGIKDITATYNTATAKNIVCTFDSAPSDEYFVYSWISGTWSHTGTMSTPIKRLITTPDDTERVFIVGGSGDYKVLNSNLTTSTVTMTDTSIVLDENIDLVERNVRVGCGSVESTGCYIYAVNHTYTGTPYPLYFASKQGSYITSTNMYNGAASAFDARYLQKHHHYKADVATSHEFVGMSFVSGGAGGTSQLVYFDASQNITAEAREVSSKMGRILSLSNGQWFWAPWDDDPTDTHGNSEVTVFDPYLNRIFALDSSSVDITGEILSVRSSTDFRSLLINKDGDRAYILNDLDRTSESFSFSDSSLPMGKYIDIINVSFVHSSFAEYSDAFYMMPLETYSAGIPSGNIAALSTTTVSAFGLNVSGDFTIPETVVSFAPIQTTTGLIEVGTFTLNDDEFQGSTSIGFDSSLADGNIFTSNIVGTSGTIFVKSGISLDYETRERYTGIITGVDPYVGGEPFVGDFVLTVTNVDEKPTGIVANPSSGTINANASTTSDVKVAEIVLTDPDFIGPNATTLTEFNQNFIEVAGPDQAFFRVDPYNTGSLSFKSDLFLKAGTTLDILTKDIYNITLLGGQIGQTFNVIVDFSLELVDNPPVAIVIGPNVASFPEDYVVPSTGLHLATFSLIDTDTNKGNYAILDSATVVQNYFESSYDLDSNSGELRLKSTASFDYETFPTLTGRIFAGNIVSEYSATGIFTLNVTDVLEPSGITATPGIVYLDEGAYPTGQLLTSLTFTNTDITDAMTIFDIRVSGSGFRSGLDLLATIDNPSTNPKIKLKDGITLDYETQSKYIFYISGYPGTNTNDDKGAQLTLIVRDINEAPLVRFDPTGERVPEELPSNTPRILVSEVEIADEELSTVTVSLIGSDASFFTFEPNTLTDNTGYISAGNLYLNSGIDFDFETKPSYTAQILAVDSSGLATTGEFVVSVGDALECFYSISGTVVNTRCPGDAFGSLSLDVEYTGTEAGVDACNEAKPLTVVWNDLPDSALTGTFGFQIFSLPAGTVSGFLYGGNIPITGLSYTIGAASDITLLQVVKDQNVCSETGYLNVVWSGGKPPYSVFYGTSTVAVPSGSGHSAKIPVTVNTTAPARVIDDAGCVVESADISFSFIQPTFNFTSEEDPLIYNGALQEFKFNFSYGTGPFNVRLYNTLSGEKTDLELQFERYDTSILERVAQVGSSGFDESGNTIVTIEENTPYTYYYDLKNQIFPGNYIIEFDNVDGCTYTHDSLLPASNINPLSIEVNVSNDTPFENNFYTIVQPILDTLFIPYRMLVDNTDMVSYLANLTDTSDIKLQIGDTVYERKVLYGSINCDDEYAIFNIKFLGIDNTDWYYTLYFYQGFDLNSTTIDILNEPIFLILPNGEKIKIVTELNNNINTIKLLKGSILTTDLITGQYKDGTQITLAHYNLEDGTFDNVDTRVKIASTSTLLDKYIAGSIFRINWLDSCEITDDLRTDTIENIILKCNATQTNLLTYRKFLLELNNFNHIATMYSLGLGNDLHLGNITVQSASTYEPVTFSWRYYNSETKKIGDIYYNNKKVTENNIQGLRSGSYICRAVDPYGNKPYEINNRSYEQLWSGFVDYIINTLKTTPEAIDFQYGDMLINVFNNRITTGAPSNIPGTENPTTPGDNNNTTEPSQITNRTIIATPNTTYTNRLVVQTQPGKISYKITGPQGFNRTFNDKVTLLQMSPGVYNIEGDETDLYNNYLYQQRKSIAINRTSNILTYLEFPSYQNSLLVETIDVLSAKDTNICDIDFYITG